jgi:hypothetical protein
MLLVRPGEELADPAAHIVRPTGPTPATRFVVKAIPPTRSPITRGGRAIDHASTRSPGSAAFTGASVLDPP